MWDLLRSRNGLAMLAALLGAAATGLYLFSQEKDFASDLLRALLGLSGGTTVGG